MEAAQNKITIETDELAELLAEKPLNLRVLDATWFGVSAETPEKTPLNDFKASHIPGAQHFDFAKIAHAEGAYMLPTAEDFVTHMRALGLRKTDRIVVYDSKGFFASPRVWWMLSSHGASNVAILNGGFPKWVKEGRTVEEGEPVVPADAAEGDEAAAAEEEAPAEEASSEEAEESSEEEPKE